MNRISEVTRRNIFDFMSVDGVVWPGRLAETEFLARLFDLENLPSYDSRYRTASGDIWQHRENNLDWGDYWVFSDDRFQLLRGDDEVFLRFLCESLHPVVRTDPTEVERLRQQYNQFLAADGFEIVENSRISNRPVFAARLSAVLGAPGVGEAARTLGALDPAYVAQQITRMEAAVAGDPDLAIGTAKELVESCCKTIIRERGGSVGGGNSLPQLMKQTAQLLALTPNDIPEQARAAETIKRLLMNLGTVAQGLAELRGQYGTGHGHAAGRKGLGTRHAKLAVGAASTLAAFLVETHREKK